MNEDVSKGVWLVANIFIGKLIASLASKMRKPELYAAIAYSLQSLGNNSKSYTTIIYVINKGRETEKNIELHLPKNKFIKILSGDKPFLEAEDNKIKIKRLISKEDTTFTISYIGEILSKDNLPQIFSDNASGKSYAKKDLIPPSRGPALFIVTVFFILVCSISTLFVFKIDPIDYVSDKYNNYKYANFYSRGFETSKYGISKTLGKYDIKNNELPVTMIDFKVSDKEITFKLKVVNKLYLNATTFAAFDLQDYKRYKKLSEKLSEDYYKDNDYKKYKKLYDGLITEFRYPTGAFSTEKVKLKMGKETTLTLTRNIANGLTPEDLNINIFITSDDNDSDITLFKFNFRTSNLKSNKLPFSHQDKDDIKKMQPQN
ncbi:hypothetical protein WKH53_12970 [Pantoea agglomerans]|uniref:hypothetical protein n=1 Tax=Enterobacter agglomerans TaxID=549 RepID=UPI003C79803B